MGEEKRRASQKRSEESHPFGWTEKIIELVLQIDSRITACRHIMQSVRNRLVANMLAAAAHKKIALVEIFCKIKLSVRTVHLIYQLFTFF